MQHRNEILIVGNIGRDADTRTSANGVTYTKFSVMTAIGEGTRKKTTWHDVVLFGENIPDGLRKGALVQIEGLQDHTKSGERYYSSIVAESIKLITPESMQRPAQRPMQQPYQRPQQAQQRLGEAPPPRQPQQRPEADTGFQADDDDIPF